MRVYDQGICVWLNLSSLWIITQACRICKFLSSCLY